VKAEVDKRKRPNYVKSEGGQRREKERGKGTSHKLKGGKVGKVWGNSQTRELNLSTGRTSQNELRVTKKGVNKSKK